MNPLNQASEQYRTFDQFLRETDKSDFDPMFLEIPDDYHDQVNVVEEWTPNSFDVPPLNPANNEQPHEFTPTRHELYFLARYWIDRQLYARHLDVLWQKHGLASKADRIAETRVKMIAKIIGADVVEEIRVELLTAWRKKLGDVKWDVFLAWSLDDQHEK